MELSAYYGSCIVDCGRRTGGLQVYPYPRVGYGSGKLFTGRVVSGMKDTGTGIPCFVRK